MSAMGPKLSRAFNYASLASAPRKAAADSGSYSMADICGRTSATLR